MILRQCCVRVMGKKEKKSVNIKVRSGCRDGGVLKMPDRSD